MFTYHFQSKPLDSQAIQEKQEACTQLVDIITAEIRRPLAELLEATQGMLEQKQLAGEYRFYMEQMAERANKIVEISNKFKDFMRFSAKFREVGSGAIEEKMNEIIARTIKMINISPLVHCMIDFQAKQFPANIIHPELLQMLLEPLLENALRFTDEGFILISLFIENKSLKFIVKDTGCGIPESKLAGICDLFLIDPSCDEHYKNAGLKLSMLKECVSLVGGELTILTQPEVGTTVSISVPIDTSEQKQIDFCLECEPRILFISNDDTLAFVIKQQLIGARYQALNSQQAHAFLLDPSLEKSPIEIIIIDALSPNDISHDWINYLYDHPLYQKTFLIVFGNNFTVNEWYDRIYDQDRICLINIDTQLYSMNALRQVIQESWAKVHERIMEVSATPKEPIRALIIDDSDFYTISFSKRLHVLGCQVEVASSGEEGLELLNQAKNDYHIVFLDVNLPGEVSGLDVAKYLQESRRRKDQAYPILVGCTAYSAKQELERCLAAGMDYAFSKPMQLANLKALLGLPGDVHDGSCGE